MTRSSQCYKIHPDGFVQAKIKTGGHLGGSCGNPDSIVGGWDQSGMVEGGQELYSR